MWIEHVVRNFANFEGRASLREYWYFHVIVILVFLALALIQELFDFKLVEAAGIWSGVIILLGLLISLVAITVRRLHDVGLSGWWSLICFIPYVGFLVLILFFLKGDKRENNYGYSPSAKGYPLRSMNQKSHYR